MLSIRERTPNTFIVRAARWTVLTAEDPALGRSRAVGGQYFNVYSTGESDYYLELVGPAPALPDQTIGVRVDFTAHADVSISDPSDYLAGAMASAGIVILNSIGQELQTYNDVPSEGTAAAGNWCTGVCISTGDFNESLLYFLQPNVPYLVSVLADAQTRDNYLSSSYGTSHQTADASVDPHFYQDALYGNPAYTLELSPGVSNDAPGAVPEPSNSTVFGIGIGLLRLLYRRPR